MTILWVIDFEYSTRLHHGATMRFVNYSRELRALGHQVYFAVLVEEEDPEPSRAWFRELIADGVTADVFELRYSPSKFARSLAARLIQPALGGLVLRTPRKTVVDAVQVIIDRQRVDVVITSKRKLFFLAPALAKAPHKILDFADSDVLYFSREARELLRERRWTKALRSVLRLVRATVEERYYVRESSTAIFVSPVDKLALDRISGLPERTHVLLNGVTLPPVPDVPKIPNRLIFSGNMNFPPNHSAALWMIRSILPLVHRELPGVQLVLAGANPPSELRALESETIRVTGFVDDMNREIACSALYVAPLISGGGFKNKVVEALANRTYVVATPMAVEFLAPEACAHLTIASSPEDIAGHIVRLLRDPAACREQLDFLYRYVCANFTWAGQTGELIKVIEQTAQ